VDSAGLGTFFNLIGHIADMLGELAKEERLCMLEGLEVESEDVVAMRHLGMLWNAGTLLK